MTDISVPKYSKKYHARDSKIRTQPATDGYRDGWERVFGKKVPVTAKDILEAYEDGAKPRKQIVYKEVLGIKK